jgi:hypothetical protein
MRRPFLLIGVLGTAMSISEAAPMAAQGEKAVVMISGEKRDQTVGKMVAKFGEVHRHRAASGADRVAELWREEDGTEQEYEEFCLEHFIAEPDLLDRTFDRLEKNFEALWGRFHQINRKLSEPLDLDLGDPLQIDYMFAKYSPSAHVNDDLFKTKIAFVVVLNFPYYTLDRKLAEGSGWSRKEWAHARLGDLFTSRVPAEVIQQRSAIFVEADNYIAEYNIFMGNLLDPARKKSFPVDLKLISHWGLRDELKSQYARPDGLERQRLIYQVMQRIIDQSIPRTVINDPRYYWEPSSNTVFQKKGEQFEPVSAVPESPRRYERFLSTFHGQRLLDPHVPKAPTLIERRFNEDREIPEKEVERLLVSIVSAPVVAEVARLIERRLGRKLEPFDIWYDGFKARGGHDPEELDRIVRRKYPDAGAFQRDLPNILRKLGFQSDKAEFLSEHIVVDPSRGAGHASGAQMRDDKAHLRTRATGGLNYKGYNIAIHELGHTVEQVFSLNGIDYYSLNGVPNTAFTEAFAFVFQDRDLDLLGLASADRQEREALKALDTFWGTYEIGGVALVDMRVWRWMYDHPGASATELREAVLGIARNVWNQHYAPVLGARDVSLLGVYSHMIESSMYLPDYPLGHIISFQIENYLKDRNLGEEMERMCRLGRLTPAHWMEEAVGTPLSAEPLLKAVAAALPVVEKK